MAGPHDKLFRMAFTRPQVARDHLRAVLPKALVDELDLDALTVEPSGFIDLKLRELTADVLLRPWNI